jgi:hypothetical protein
MSQETINVKPSARILKVLGDIEFDNWQCLAEFVDNAFDDFTEIERSQLRWPDGFRVSIVLPQGQITEDSEVIVTDTGRGMDLTALNNAVRAGWSSNDPFSKLGLFGMGFNVASARLGRVTKVLTTREGDRDWVGVVINVDEIGDDFEVPVLREPKEDPRVHGTRVSVRKLDPVRASLIARNQANLRATLGDVYSYLLDHKAYSLVVNGVQVKPRRACRWDEARSVKFGGGTQAEEIPAYISIGRDLPAMETCLHCRNWQEPGRRVCLECGSEDLAAQSRKIHGWLGIQRYLDRTDFGISFFRNGRKILRNYKGLFSWTNPNDPLAGTELEYPVELGLGRIIGEVHLDYVPVNYQKTAFEWSDRSWKAAAEYLRGRGPLLPRKAAQLGWPPNESPLARLVRGYRRADPGYRCLVPGDGEQAIHAKAKEWADRFAQGDPEFQDDSKWWEAVVFHESQQNQEVQSSSSTDPQTRLGLRETLNAAPIAPQVQPVLPVIETEQEKLARLRRHGVEIPSLTGEFGLMELGTPLRLTTVLVTGTDVRDSGGNRTPVYFAPEANRAFVAFVDTGHAVFTEFADDPATFVFIQLAEHLRVRARSELSLSQVVAMLKDAHLPQQKLDLATSAAKASETLRAVREKMAVSANSNPDRTWQLLHQDERTAVEIALVNEGRLVSLADAQRSGEFVAYAPPMSLPRMVEDWPEAFFDGRVFRSPFGSLSSPGARRLSVGRVVGYLYDAARLATVDTMAAREISRARLSLNLLAHEIGAESADA